MAAVRCVACGDSGVVAVTTTVFVLDEDGQPGCELEPHPEPCFECPCRMCGHAKRLHPEARIADVGERPWCLGMDEMCACRRWRP